VRKAERAAATRAAGKLARTCPECGAPVPPERRTYCSDPCREAHERAVVIPRRVSGRVAAMAEARANGRDPSHGGAAAGKRAETLAARQSARREWETAHPDVDLDAERERFAREILPGLQGVPIAKIARAAGISTTYAQLIRAGIYTPHPLYFARLVDLLAADGNK